jgi:glycerol-3-phosphate cytidylyltransferase-like family protein
MDRAADSLEDVHLGHAEELRGAAAMLSTWILGISKEETEEGG